MLLFIFKGGLIFFLHEFINKQVFFFNHPFVEFDNFVPLLSLDLEYQT